MQKRRRTKAKSVKPQNTARNEKKMLTRDLPDAVDKRFHSILDTMIESFRIIGFDWKCLYQYLYILQAEKEKEVLLGNNMMETYTVIENFDLSSKFYFYIKELKSLQIENIFKYSAGLFQLDAEVINVPPQSRHGRVIV